MAAADQFYTFERIHDDTYRIDENGAANCYLVIGSEKALLIDTCWGYCQELCAKSVCRLRLNEVSQQ